MNTHVQDHDSNEARLARMRRDLNGGRDPLEERRAQPPPAGAEARLYHASLIVSDAMTDAEQIARAEPLHYPDFNRKFVKGQVGRRDTYPFTLKHAKQIAARAAKNLRKAWEVLDPSIGQGPAFDAAERPLRYDNGEGEPIKVRAYLHPTHDGLVTTDETAYTKPRELVLHDDVADRIDWLEKGIAEWRAAAMEAEEQLREMKTYAAEIGRQLAELRKAKEE